MPSRHVRTAAATGRNGRRAPSRTPSSPACRWLDERLGVAKGGRVLLDKIFPDHWSFLLGEIALYSFVILIPTGIFLSLYFVPSAQDIIYHGVYKPLRGVEVSAAYASTVNLSFAVRSGSGHPPDAPLGRRRLRRAPSPCTCAAIFFTGAYRKPRELNWMIGVTLLILAI